MGKKLIFIGGGAHLSVALEAAQLSNADPYGVLDNELKVGATRSGLRVLGGDAKIDELIAANCDFHVSVTDPTVRARLRTQLEARKATLVTLIHPRASVSETAKLGTGCFIAAGAIICPSAALGSGVVLNTGAQIDHDCRIGNDCHIAPGAVLAGNVIVGDGCFISSGAILAPNIEVGAKSIVGAGSVVLKNIGPGEKVLGNPARRADI